jgi:Holliday junction resolvase-like predicted endonuclease
MGHEILARNYRTRFYEIDIISRFGDKVFFTEVKYRQSAKYGDGISYITPKKLQKMRFAAEDFLSRKKISSSATLAAASVSGESFEVEDWFEIEE